MDTVLRRIRTQLGWTQEYLASIAGVTPLSVLKYEQGLYTSPSPSITYALSRASGLTEKQIIDTYKHDVKNHREAMAPLVQGGFDDCYMKRQPPVGRFKEFVDFLSPESLMGFCKLLAVHPSVVARYEKAPGSRMPAQLREALLDCGLKNWQVDFIDLRHTQGDTDTAGRRPALVS